LTSAEKFSIVQLVLRRVPPGAERSFLTKKVKKKEKENKE